MVEIYGSHFEFAGKKSRNYDLIIANVNSERFAQISGQIEGYKIFNKKTKSAYLVGDDYSQSPLSIEVEILTSNQRCFDRFEMREIEKWLFNRRKYEKFYIDTDDSLEYDSVEYVDALPKRLYLNCRFINPVKLEYNDGVVGYKAFLEADSCMWWQDAISKSFTLNNDSGDISSISITVDTDIDDYVYPKVTIMTGGQGGSIYIKNISDDGTRFTRFSELSPNTQIIMNGETNYISGQNYEKFYRQNFPRLVDGNNTIQIGGNVKTIKYEFSNRRFW